MTTRWGYSDCADAEVWRGSCETHEQAVEEGRAEYGAEATFYVMHGTTPDPGAWVPDADWIVESICDNAQSNCGEVAEDYGSDVREEALEELNTLLRTWARTHMAPTFWEATGAPIRIDPAPPAPEREP